jgi:hypothetical protein
LFLTVISKSASPPLPVWPVLESGLKADSEMPHLFLLGIILYENNLGHGKKKMRSRERRGPSFIFLDS